MPSYATGHGNICHGKETGMKSKKIVLARDALVGKETGLIFKRREPDIPVYRVVTAHNFRARKFYYPDEIDYLMDLGVEIQFKEK